MDYIQEKKKKISIRDFNDFNNELNREGYILKWENKEDFSRELSKAFKVNIDIGEYLYSDLIEGKVKYKVNNIRDLLNYIEKILLFQCENNKLWNKLKHINKLAIHRIEYDRVMGIQEDVSDILKITETLSDKISREISEVDKLRLGEIEKHLDEGYVYAKDIELLKKIITTNRDRVKEGYDEETQVKTIVIEMPKEVDCQYIKHEKGSVLHHKYLDANIPRINRLIRNLDKYISRSGEILYEINQSSTLQDSINIAVATYDNQEFKSISGSNEIDNYCKSPEVNKGVFISRKVNRVGKLGIGYNRINDSEKKILEHIQGQIEQGRLRDYGELNLYTKWKPCRSCYYVIHQFMEKHPNINVQVRYIKQYG